MEMTGFADGLEGGERQTGVEDISQNNWKDVAECFFVLFGLVWWHDQKLISEHDEFEAIQGRC